MSLPILSDYEKGEYEKLRTVVCAAEQNRPGDEVEITTSGYNPHAKVRIKAYILKKFLRGDLPQ